MRELPEPKIVDEFNGAWFTRDQVLAIQRQAYEDGLRDAKQRCSTKRPGTLEIVMAYHLPEKTLAVTQLLTPEQLSHSIAPHLIVGADAGKMYLHIAAMLTASQEQK